MLLSVQSVCKSYEKKTGQKDRKVLNHCSLDLKHGEKIAVVGPSGSGKTTLLNLIGTLDKPDSGNIYFNEQNISDFTAKDSSVFRNQQVGFVFQMHYLLPQLTLWENIILPSLPNKKDDKNIHERAEILLKKTGIWEQHLQKPGELSGGECQRAAVVRALINKPVLLLADEPTGALDEENANLLSDLLIKINTEENISLLVVTHSLKLARKMDKQYRLINGQLKILNNNEF